MNGSNDVTLTTSFPTFTATFSGATTVAVNDSTPVEGDVELTLEITVTNVQDGVQLDVSSTGTIDGQDAAGEFTTTFEYTPQ